MPVRAGPARRAQGTGGRSRRIAVVPETPPMSWRPFGSTARVGLLLASLATLAVAGDEASAPAGAGKKPATTEKAAPEIRWARTWGEATEEATERNVPIYIHSHGST
jgi:hypothetical protein